jgi:phospholipid-translocating ATPase
MAPESTANSPLLKQMRKRRSKNTWWSRNVSKPFSDFSLVEFIFVRKIKPSPARSVYINQPLPAEFTDKKGRPLSSRRFDSNQNVTSKYTIFTFLPRNLLEQFRRVANVFLCVNVREFTCGRVAR